MSDEIWPVRPSCPLSGGSAQWRWPVGASLLADCYFGPDTAHLWVMLPVAPPVGPSAFAPTVPLPTRAHAPQNDQVLLALPPTAASASVLRSLRSEGVSVSPVSDGIAVLDAVRARDPALLVLDVELP